MATTYIELNDAVARAEAARDRVEAHNAILIGEIDKQRAELAEKAATVAALSERIAAIEVAVDAGIVADPNVLATALATLCRESPELVAGALADLFRRAGV